MTAFPYVNSCRYQPRCFVYLVLGCWFCVGVLVLHPAVLGLTLHLGDYSCFFRPLTIDRIGLVMPTTKLQLTIVTSTQRATRIEQKLR